MKNKDIYDLYEGLYEISQDKELKFDIQTSFILAKDKHTLEPLYNAIIEARQKAFEKYGKQLETGEWQIPKENIKDFTKEWNDFMEMDSFVSLQGITLEDIKSEKIGIDLIEKLLILIDK